MSKSFSDHEFNQRTDYKLFKNAKIFFLVINFSVCKHLFFSKIMTPFYCIEYWPNTFVSKRTMKIKSLKDMKKL